MKLTRRSDYALRVLMYLAIKPDEFHTIPELAERYKISKNHLMKVANDLSNNDLVLSKQGRGGGLRLSKQARAIRIGEVVELMEQSLDVIDCKADGGCLLFPSCKLKKALNEATRSFIDTLNSYTLADLVRNQKILRALVD